MLIPTKFIFQALFTKFNTSQDVLLSITQHKIFRYLRQVDI